MAYAFVYIAISTFYFICLCRGLIVPNKEKRKEKKSRFIKKLGHSKSENFAAQSHRTPGLVGLLEILRAQLEVLILRPSFHLFLLQEALVQLV